MKDMYDKMKDMYFIKAWLLSQIIYDTENAARITSEMVIDGKVSLDNVLKMPDTLIEELQHGLVDVIQSVMRRFCVRE